MKLSYKLIITAFAAALALVSCQKESGSGDNGSPADSRITVTATIESAATKVAFTEGVDEIKGSWEADDHIIGWDEKGRAIELAVEKIRDDGAAEFTTVPGSAPLPASGKVYMIYAPGKSLSDVGDKSLAYDLTTQNGDKVPALMTATGIVAGNRLELRFDNELALVAVKNPKFPVTAETTVRGLKISGDNINTVATFSMNGDDLVMASSTPGALIRNCEFTTSATGASEVMTYFAVLPDSTPADITVSTVDPEGYQNSYTGQSFVKGQCYIMDSQTIDKQKFSIIIADGIENGTVTTDPENECGWGETVTVNAEPDEHYIVEQITVTTLANSTNIPVTGTTFTMPQENVTVTAAFIKKSYTITKGTETNGTFDVSAGSIQWGENVSISNVEPASGYVVDRIYYTDGTTETDIDATSLTFEMPKHDITVCVTFKVQIPGNTPDYNIITW